LKKKKQKGPLSASTRSGGRTSRKKKRKTNAKQAKKDANKPICSRRGSPRLHHENGGPEKKEKMSSLGNVLTPIEQREKTATQTCAGGKRDRKGEGGFDAMKEMPEALKGERGGKLNSINKKGMAGRKGTSHANQA